MTPLSYWLDTAPPFAGGAGGELDGRADVVIIGAGFTGLSAALGLTRCGASVAVLEAGKVLGEASGRNGGQCNNGTLQDYVSLVDNFGLQRANAYYQSFNKAVDTVESLVQSEGIACGFNRCGKLKLAAKPAHYDQLARTWEALQAGIDPDVQLLSATEVRREVASNAFHGGLLLPLSAQLHVGKFGIGLAQRAAATGAKIYESTPVTRLKQTPQGSWRIGTPRGEMQANQVLLATGGSGPGPFGWFRRRIVPVGSFIVVTEPLAPQLIEALLPQARSYVTSKNIGNYFRTTPDNRLLFGGRARFALSNPRSDLKSGKVLQAGLADMFPELADTAIDYCWGGTVDMSADRLPRAGERNGLFYCMGYSGHGVQMAVHMGQVMAGILQGQNAENPWSALPWPPVPGHFGKPWFLPAVGLYYKLQDAIH